MKRIQKPSAPADKAMGNQKLADCIYRPFTYTLTADADGGTLIYNCLTGAMVFLSKEEFSYFKNGAEPGCGITDALIENWFLVPENHDDAKLYSQVFSFLKLFNNAVIKKDLFNYFIIYPTTNCNARCFYCFEHGKTYSTMSPKTAEDTADFIIKKCKGQPIRIKWFGGEPLYNMEAIDIITSTLQENGIDYASTMITNGYLFDDTVVKRAQDLWKLEWVQITLDGTEEIYNRYKNYIYNDGSAFVRVTDNIERLLSSNIEVAVRMNIHKHNEEDLYRLTEYMAERYGKYDKFSCLVRNLSDNRKRAQLTLDEVAEINQRIERFNDTFQGRIRMMSDLLPKEIRYHWCQADDDNAVAILPDGHLGKCDQYIDSDYIGSIYNDEMDHKMIAKYKEVIPKNERCHRCPLSPLCTKLVMCPAAENINCDPIEISSGINSYRKKMINTYKKYLNDTEN